MVNYYSTVGFMAYIITNSIVISSSLDWFIYFTVIIKDGNLFINFIIIIIDLDEVIQFM